MGYSYVLSEWTGYFRWRFRGHPEFRSEMTIWNELFQTSKGRITLRPLFAKVTKNFNPSPIGRIAGFVVVQLSGILFFVVPPEKKMGTMDSWIYHDLTTSDRPNDDDRQNDRPNPRRTFAKLCAMPGRQGPSLDGRTAAKKCQLLGGCFCLSGISGIFSYQLGDCISPIPPIKGTRTSYWVKNHPQLVVIVVIGSDHPHL